MGGGGNVGEVTKDPDKSWRKADFRFVYPERAAVPEQLWKNLLLFEFHDGRCSSRCFRVVTALAKPHGRLWGSGVQLADGW